MLFLQNSSNLGYYGKKEQGNILIFGGTASIGEYSREVYKRILYMNFCVSSVDMAMQVFSAS